MDSLLNHDVSFLVMEFLHGEYVFYGLVNRWCRDYFRRVGDVGTRVSACFESVPRMMGSGILDEAGIHKDRYVLKSASTEVLDYCETHGIVASINGALEHAIRRVDLDAIAWLESRFELHGPACMIAAVESGSLDMVKRFCVDNLLDYRAHNFFPDGSHICNLRDRDRMIVCDRWRDYVGDYLIESVKETGNFEILRWLHDQKIPDPRECKGLVGRALHTGSKEMVKWMLRHGYLLSPTETSLRSRGVHQGDYVKSLRGMNEY
jgi:hypothetical protein